MSLPPSVTETKGRFTGKTVVITGGGGTFGKVGAQYFAKEGANVVLLDFNKAALDASVESVKNSSSSNIVGVLCNVTDVDDVAAAVALATGKFSRIDLLWNNAGYQVTGASVHSPRSPSSSVGACAAG